MIARWPRYISTPKADNPAHVTRVETEKDHRARFPEDYKNLMVEIAADPTGGRATFVGDAKAEEERERCAVIAETFPNGGKVGQAIAYAIRGGKMPLDDELEEAPPMSAKDAEPLPGPPPPRMKTETQRPLVPPVPATASK